MSDELQPSGPVGQGGSEGAVSAEVVAPVSALPPAIPSANEGEIQWGDAPEALAAPAVPPPPPPTEGENAAPAPAPEPPADFTAAQLQNGTWELRTPTGNVYKGATELAAYQAAARGKVEADRTIRELREKIAAPAAPAPPPVQPTAPTIDPTDELIADMSARGLGYANAKEYRAALDRAQSQLHVASQMAEDQRVQQVSTAFLQKVGSDFVPTPANAERLDEGIFYLSRLAGLPDGQTLPITVDLIEAAHALVKGRGLYEAVKPEQITSLSAAAPTPRTPTGQFAPRSNVMPMPPAATAPSPRALAPDPFSMSDAEWAAFVANQPRSA